MKRLIGIGRSRTGRVGLVAGIVLAVIGGLSAPAFAHHAILSGSTYCANNDHVITWSIGNNRDDEAMTIVWADATINGDHYAVTGYTTPVGFSGTTTATTVIPGPVTGTVTLAVHVEWPTYDNVNTTDVPLEGNCGCGCTSTTTAPTTTEPTTTTTIDNRCDVVHPSEGIDDPQGHNNPDCETTTTLPVTTTTEHHCGCTTTTTEATTTTTEPTTTTTEATTTTTEATTTTTQPEETTTTQPEETTTTTMPTTTSTQAEGTTTIVTTTTLGHQGSTVPTTQPPTSGPTTTQAPPVQGQLPFTGSGVAFPVLFGLGSLILGGFFAFRKRGVWTRS